MFGRSDIFEHGTCVARFPWDVFSMSKTFDFASSYSLSSNTGDNSSSHRTPRTPACFVKMDGDSFGFIITSDLFIAFLCSACWPTAAPVRMLGAEALMKHSCVRGVLSEENTACLREGSGVTMQEPRARRLKSNSTCPA